MSDNPLIKQLSREDDVAEYRPYRAPHFRYGEFFCKCGKCPVQLMHFRILEKLEELRDALGDAPITITSGYRCPEHNAKVGGAPASKHMEGIAADIKVKGVKPMTVVWAADKIGFTGIKAYKSWTHVDLRDGPEWKPNL